MKRVFYLGILVFVLTAAVTDALQQLKTTASRAQENIVSTITGGYVYRGSLYPALSGKYICVDYVTGNLWLLTPDGSSYTATRQAGLPANITGFGENNSGELFAVSHPGVLYAITATSPSSMENTTEHNSTAAISLYPTIVSDRTIYLQTTIPVEDVSITDLTGKRINLPLNNLDKGIHTLNLPALSSGVYYLRVTTDGNKHYTKYFQVE